MSANAPETTPGLRIKSNDFEAALGYAPNTGADGRVLCSPAEREILVAYKSDQARLRAQRAMEAKQSQQVESRGQASLRALGYIGVTTIVASSVWMASWGAAYAYVQGETETDRVVDNFLIGAFDSVIHVSSLATRSEQIPDFRPLNEIK